MLILTLFACVLLDVARELCFKCATMQTAATGPNHPSVAAAWPSIAALLWMGLGAGLWAAELYLYLSLLTKLPLNIAFPMMSLTYAAVPLFAWVLLGEAISLRRWLGIGLVTAGVVAVGSASTL